MFFSFRVTAKVHAKNIERDHHIKTNNQIDAYGYEQQKCKNLKQWLHQFKGNKVNPTYVYWHSHALRSSCGLAFLVWHFTYFVCLFKYFVVTIKQHIDCIKNLPNFSFNLPSSFSNFRLLRHRSRIGVPINPALDLSCFSIYRRYVSGKSLESFTKNTNVGGLIAACKRFHSSGKVVRGK